MNTALPPIPITIAKLIIGFTHNKLLERGTEELDRWLEESDVNLEIFEALTESVDDNVFSPDELIIETDDLVDCWMVAGLIAKQMRTYLSMDEERYLNEWREAAPRHEELYQLFSNKANLQTFVTWLKKVNEDSPAGLN